MSTLVTGLTAAEVLELQASMQDPAMVEQRQRKFTEAVQPARVLDLGKRLPDAAHLLDCPTELYGMGWAHSGEFPAGTQIEVVPSTGLFKECKVYHRDPARYDQAKAAQPEPGERPSPVGPTSVGSRSVIMRQADGGLVLQTTDNQGTHTQRLV